uniref:Polyprenal reductase n=1 Tax=Parastrongyloides trichosuri TaxID=131310 RepID=A0A0N4ZIE6_PARTI
MLCIGILISDENGKLKYLKSLIFYGKTLDTQNFLAKLSVSKSSFYIFYVIGEILSLGIFVIVLVFPKLTKEIIKFLSLFGSSEKISSYETTILVLLCLIIHIGRRLYECLFVSVYSPSTIHVAHFIMGILHYTFLPLSVLSTLSFEISNTLNFSQYLFFISFICLNYLQNGVANDFANLRKEKNNKISDFNHKVCLNGLHKYICCPHFLYEILIYVTLYLISDTRNLFYFLMFVITNQMIAAKTNQIWYRKKFHDDNQIANRKALIPFIY